MKQENKVEENVLISLGLLWIFRMFFSLTFQDAVKEEAVLVILL